VASVILGSLAALGITFFLGYSLGHRVLERPLAPRASAGRPPPDPLAALDQPARPDGGEPAPKLNFHEALTSPKPPVEKLPPPPRPAPAPAKLAGPVPPSGPVFAAVPAPRPAVPPPAPPPPPVAVAAASAGPASGAAAASPAPRASREGAFAVQVGSTPDRSEANRLALRFPGRVPKVVTADVPGKGRWYRVQLGPFDSRDEAERYLRDLERDTGSKGFVTSTNRAEESP